MHRRIFIRNVGFLAGATLLTQKTVLASIFKKSPQSIRMLHSNVGIFTDRGGTIGFLLSKDGIVVIDSQFPDSAQKFMTEVKTQSESPIKYLLNTHHHGDHTGGNIAFKGIVEHVVAHENSLANQRRVAEGQNALDKTLLPDITFKEDWNLKMGNEKIKADYFGPAHTNGDAVYHFDEANITHLGDLMFNRRHPVVDRSAGANIGNWVKVLDKVLKKSHKDTLFIFGHSLKPGNETGSGEDVKKFQDYLTKLLQFAEVEINRGISKEDFAKNTTIPGVIEWEGNGQRAFTAAYEEIAEKLGKK